jgi:PAS domain S-box-containing protein
MQSKKLVTAECFVVRLVLPVVAAGAAALLGLRLPGDQSPFYLFLAASTLTAISAGLIPAFIALSVSLLLIRLVFISPYSILTWPGEMYIQQIIQITVFGLVTAIVCCMAAACRRDRNIHRSRADQYKAVADSAPTAVILFNERGCIGFVNRRAEEMFNTTAAAMIGLNIGQFLPDTTCQISKSHRFGFVDTRAENFPRSAVAHQITGDKIDIEFTLNSVDGGSCTAAWIRSRSSSDLVQFGTLAPLKQAANG